MMYYRISKNEKNLFFGKKIAQVWAVTLIILFADDRTKKYGITPLCESGKGKFNSGTADFGAAAQRGHGFHTRPSEWQNLNGGINCFVSNRKIYPRVMCYSTSADAIIFFCIDHTPENFKGKQTPVVHTILVHSHIK